MGGSYILVGSNLEKYGKFWKNSRFSGRIRPDTAGLGKYCTGGYGRIGVYRVNAHGIYRHFTSFMFLHVY